MSTLPLLGLCRLVVCLVLDLLYGHTQRRMHRFEDWSPVDPYRRLGNPFSYS